MSKLLLLLLLVVCLPTVLHAETVGVRDRYFLSGDGWVRFVSARSGKALRVQYRLPDGSYPRTAQQQINRFFGVSVDSGDRISLRLVSLLDYVEDRFARPITILSGYRSPAYNQSLRKQGRLAAKTSLHMEGMAADIRLGKTTAAKAFHILKDMDCCGVGYYHGSSLHIDTGPARFWDERSSKVDTDISDHNKRIMLRTDRDVYLPGEIVEFRLARITDYPLGLATAFAVIREGQVLEEFVLDGGSEVNCKTIATPAQRTATWKIPSGFHPTGKVEVQVRFCNKPFLEMPEQIESNHILILPAAHSSTTPPKAVPRPAP